MNLHATFDNASTYIEADNKKMEHIHCLVFDRSDSGPTVCNCMTKEIFSHITV